MEIDLLFRWVHILAAIVLVGGTFFLRTSLAPTLAAQSPELQQTLLAGWRPRWARWVMISSGLLLVSGLFNAVRIIVGYEFATVPYDVLVAVKLLLALAIFWISAALAGRSNLANRLREKLSFWLTVNVILSIGIVCLGGYMKMAERTPKPADDVTPAATSAVTINVPQQTARISEAQLGQES